MNVNMSGPFWVAFRFMDKIFPCRFNVKKMLFANDCVVRLKVWLSAFNCLSMEGRILSFMQSESLLYGWNLMLFSCGISIMNGFIKILAMSLRVLCFQACSLNWDLMNMSCSIELMKLVKQRYFFEFVKIHYERSLWLFTCEMCLSLTWAFRKIYLQG